MEEELIFTIDDKNIATLTFNRPHVHNAFNIEILTKLIEIFRKFQDTPTIRALIIRGNGKSFCAGADLSQMNDAAHFTDEENHEEARLLSQMLYFLDTLTVPTIAYVHGAVLGGGIGILSCSDIVIAESQTIFGFPETGIGLIPAVISPYVLRAIPMRYARRYYLTGERFDASKAQHIGLIHEIVEAERADAAIDKFIRYFMTGGPKAVKEAKKLLYQLAGPIPENIRLQTTESITNIRRSEEARQGIKAFLDKTTPPWVPKGPPSD